MAAKPQWVWAKRSAAVAHPSGTGTHRVSKGDTWPADDPLVKKHPDLFSDIPTVVKTSNRKAGGGLLVEQATAAPGESRF